MFNINQKESPQGRTTAASRSSKRWLGLAVVLAIILTISYLSQGSNHIWSNLKRLLLDTPWVPYLHHSDGLEYSANPLENFRYTPLPLGSIKPEGWLLDQFQLMASGFPGHEYEFYPFISKSPWLGGNETYSGLHEEFPYWFNGIVPLAYSLDDERLKKQVDETVNTVLDLQAKDGWIGPEVGTARNFWGRYPFLLGLIQLVDADPGAYEERAVEAMHRFTKLMNKMLKDDYRGYKYHPGDALNPFDSSWGRVRTGDLLISLQWLLEKHPRKQHKLLRENMNYLVKGAMKWEWWWQRGIFPEKDLYDLPRERWRPYFPFVHGVNVAQGLKNLATIYRLTGNETLLELTRQGLHLTFKNHGAVFGSVLADERLDGLAPYSGAELCTTVETLYTMAYLYQILGENRLADHTEKVAYNALPAAVTPDWWAHQYMTQTNQPFSRHLDPTPFFNTDGWSNTFGLEPNYPCCTVNHHQGLPKFLANSFARVGTNGLAHTFLGPANVSLTLDSGNVTVRCLTNYPFEHTLRYEINSTGTFTFHVKEPLWVLSSFVTLNGTSLGVEQYNKTEEGYHNIRKEIPPGTTHMTVHFQTDPVAYPRANDTVTISQGPLLYSLDIKHNISQSLPKHFREKRTYHEHQIPSECRDHTITNGSAWAIAIDPSRLRFKPEVSSLYPTHDEQITPPTPLENPIWAPEARLPYFLVDACEIEWPLRGGENGPPDLPPPVETRRCVGEMFEARLIPMGAAKIHMVQLPTIKLDYQSRKLRGEIG